MKMHLVGLAILSVLMGAVSLPSTAQNDDLRVTIHTDKKVYRIGEPMHCTLILGNTGNQPLVVNKRLVLNHSAFFPHEVLFSITAPDGKMLSFIPMVMVSINPKPEDFVTLYPSQFVRRTWELTRYFSFEKEGRYRIQALYENYYEPPGMSVWKGKITSNKVEVEVTK